MKETNDRRHHVVIVGGGFAGLYAAKALRDAPVRVTLIDKRNFHLFQPLLYQVATGGLSPGDIASPLRAILADADNITVLNAAVEDIDPHRQQVWLDDPAPAEPLPYDSLIVATGVGQSYFGNDQWAASAPGLKTVEDALEIRRRVLAAFEAAEREPDPARRQAWLTFVVVGGGPTGVELAGAIGELAHGTLAGEFRQVDPAQARVVLLEGVDRVLSTYPAELSAAAAESLRQLGVTVETNTFLLDITAEAVVVRDAASDALGRIPTRTVLWAAGVQGSPLARRLAQRGAAELDRQGRIIVGSTLTVPGYDNLYVVGDLAHAAHQTGEPLPGVAQVAIQQGRYAAGRIQARLQGRDVDAFHYQDRGNLAVIGRNAAVADLGRLRLSGFPAWLMWIFIHIVYLIGFDNKLLVLIQWAWNYFTRNRGARLITLRDDEQPVWATAAAAEPAPSRQRSSAPV
ncbi:MAG: NAD(P)/FAD-dependent oxidoreductase [Candidatus Promineifilaceae bacterium]|nr:NAD(P)/FAD-dependent oxidoreductase [Candidatus Promineifilaceae bacterium]